MIINKQLIGNLKGLKLNLEFTKGTLDTDIKSLKKAARQGISNELINRAKEISEKTNTSNSTLGSWVLVDAETGKQIANPNNGHTGSIVCDLGTCGSQGSFGKEAAAFGGVYVLENLADPITGNIAGRCASGDCQFNFDTSSMLSAEASVLTEETKASIEASRAVVAATKEVTDQTLSGTKDVASNMIEKLQSVSDRIRISSS